MDVYEVNTGAGTSPQLWISSLTTAEVSQLLTLPSNYCYPSTIPAFGTVSGLMQLEGIGLAGREKGFFVKEEKHLFVKGRYTD